VNLRGVSDFIFCALVDILGSPTPGKEQPELLLVFNPPPEISDNRFAITSFAQSHFG
jgi:hypothetical protein